MGQLEVLVIPSGHKKEESVWKYVGGRNIITETSTINLCSVKLALYFAEQGYYWKEAQIEVSKRIQAIRIRATTGMSGPKGDMAIDDVKVSSQFTQLFTFFYV